MTSLRFTSQLSTLIESNACQPIVSILIKFNKLQNRGLHGSPHAPLIMFPDMRRMKHIS